MKSRKVAITGGHLAPAQALTESYLKNAVQVVFLGRKHAFSAKKDITLEFKTMTALSGVNFYEVPAARLKLKDIPLLIKGVLRSLEILSEEHPDKLISFGGYIGVPAVIAARILGIPVYLHEQTIRPGRANILCARMARRVYTAFPEAVTHFSPQKTKCIGNPFREAATTAHKPDYFPGSHKKPILLVMGGSTGSHSINLIIERQLPALTQKYTIIHQIGDSEYGDYERLIHHKSTDYIPVRFMSAPELSYLYKHAYLTISRSGANTFFDLLYFEAPSLLVPLPWSARDEQKLQARLLEKLGVALVYEQHEAPQRFLDRLSELEKNRSTMKNNFSHLTQYKKLIISPDILLHEIERD
jgi:UDP-N-acetylglucosamine--N-acetylmuramyl-(pentapeptide) pyrophosphoryl-undecaprenol N-acetylglucosamine transferase